MTRRRDVLRGGACLAAGSTLGCPSDDGSEPRLCPLDAAPEVEYRPPSETTETLAAALLDATEDDVFSVVTGLLREHPVDTVLGAILVAGARGIEPDSGGELHGTLAMHAVTHFTARLPEALSLVPVYYAGHALKFRQGRSGNLIGDAPAATERSADDACARFDAAMAARDPEAADVAVVDLLASVPVDRVVDCVIRWAPRNEGHIGHLPIWFGLGVRALDTLGWSHARPVLRSMVRDATTIAPGTLEPIYDATLPELASMQLPAGSCVADEGLSRELLSGLRTRNPEEAAAFMLERVRASSPEQALWDGFALSGTEDLIAEGAGVALHRFDTFNAMHHLYRRTVDPVTRQMLLVATAAYACTSAFGDQTDVLALEPEDAPDVDRIFESVVLGPERAAQTVLGFLDAGGTIDAVQRRAEELAVVNAHPVDEHDYKFPVAVIEQTHLTSASFQPWVLAAIGGQDGRSPGTHQPEWDELEAVLAEIATL